MAKVKPWAVRIDEAQSRGYFKPSDKARSSNWVTCACGRQDPLIPRTLGGAPRDERLYRLGTYFDRTVKTNDFNKARELLALIDARSAEILRELETPGA